MLQKRLSEQVNATMLLLPMGAAYGANGEKTGTGAALAAL